MTPTRRTIASTLTAVATAACATIAAAGSFVLDQVSPTLLGGPATAAHILNDPGPTIGYDPASLGLVAGDLIDAISNGRDPLDASIHGPADHIFSVTRSSNGLVGSGVWIEINVGDTPPGNTPGHPADLFLWQNGAVGNILAPAGLGWVGGFATGDEANTGLVNAPPFPGDNVDAYERTRRGGPPATMPVRPIFFSLAPGSPSLAGLGSEGDIFAVGGPFGAAPVVFATAASLGIPAGVVVDLDALSLEVRPGPGGMPILHRVEYSVSSVTATGFALNGSGDLVDSGADLIQSNGLGVARVGHQPADLGLDDLDDVDALETLTQWAGPFGNDG
jgi:hypothetical protein